MNITQPLIIKNIIGQNASIAHKLNNITEQMKIFEGFTKYSILTKDYQANLERELNSQIEIGVFNDMMKDKNMWKKFEELYEHISFQMKKIFTERFKSYQKKINKKFIKFDRYKKVKIEEISSSRRLKGHQKSFQILKEIRNDVSIMYEKIVNKHIIKLVEE